jgi:hypothetical protein
MNALRKIFLLGLALCSAVLAPAQTLDLWDDHSQYILMKSVALKVGANGGAPIGPVPEGASGKPGVGLMVALVGQFHLKGKIFFQPELEYSFKGATFHTPISGDTIENREIPAGSGNFYPFPTTYAGSVDGSFANHYLIMPMMFNLRLANWSVEAGPWVGYLLKGQNSGLADIVVGNNYTSVEDEPFDQTEFLNGYDYGVAAGVNYEHKSRLFGGLRLSYGLRSVYESDYSQVDGSFRNIYAQLGMGYRFNAFGN